ncbi:MAG: GC-type dockerin domain-anchored protein [Phycisphaerales bacterium JB039]
MWFGRIPLLALGVAAAAAAQCPSQRVFSPTPWYNGNFGSSVAVEGDLAVIADVSDHTFCSISTCSSGAVHVFRRDGDRWNIEATLYSSAIAERDAFGASLALDGARFAAGSPGDDSAEPDAGAVYIFEHDGSGWVETAQVLPAEPRWNSHFASDGLALQGDTLVVGEVDHIIGGISAGAAYVYRLKDGAWSFRQKLTAPEPRLGARFGNAIALDGQWLMIAARNDDEMGHNAGAVYIYRSATGGDFELQRKLIAPGEPWNQVFGADVALDGQRMAVGASSADGALIAQGVVHMFELAASEWRHTATLFHDDPIADDALGASVDLSGDIVVAGATRWRFPGQSIGAAYAFRRRADGSWGPSAHLRPATFATAYGRSIATDGATAIVGAPDEWVGTAQQAGTAHIFDLRCILCEADLDGDGELTFFDFLAFGNLFAAGDLRADFTGDGALDLFDFLAFQNQFAAGCS